ncbi:hypothetical protein [Actinomadura sp. HBU206391]|uniref:hypothetical protein n=1 Tax=Actinomadura sp. HBU206391 TaxID=2731692 RepID=UPI0021C65013|nr:hypothetical protein [Actinomadura sp. HBU206391]
MVTMLLGSATSLGSARVDFSGDSPDTLVGGSVAPGDLNRDGLVDFVHAGEAGDRFGREVAFNDLNGDDRWDLAIGAPGENAWDGMFVLLNGTGSGVTTSGARAFGSANVGGPGKAGWFAASLAR